VSGGDAWELDGDPWQHARRPLPPPPRPGERISETSRRREEQLHEWARSADPVKRFRAAHGGWDGFCSTPTG
jgi:hypothetical protein